MENSCGFVHLHNHSMYSLLDGALKPSELIDSAVNWGMGAIALTDHGNMFGAVEFYLKAKEKGIKALIGSEVYVAIDGMKSRHAARGNNDGANHLVLLAATNQGYRNLMKIVSMGYLEGFYYRPRIDKEYLRQYSEGLIALSACIGGEIAQLIIQGHVGDAEKAALEYVDIFGKGNFYLEIQRHGIPEEKPANDGLIEISKKFDIPLVATNDAHYLKAGHAESHEVLLCLSTGKTLNDENRMKMETDQIYLKSPDEMKELFADIPEAIENTVKIAMKCDVQIKTGEYQSVSFTVPEDFEGNTDDYLDYLSHIGLKKRYGDKADEYIERLEYELRIIKQMGFSDYFLAIYDCTRAAAEMGIPVGTARGSAGGSIVAYSVGITNLDPMKYDLIFERFLNPERVSMPDFDVDYADRDRGKMIDYVKNKYGSDHVCQIITFGSMKAKMVVRDVGRVLGMSYADVDIIAKLIPDNLDTNLKNAFEQVPELRELEEKDEIHAKLFKHARILEGLSRHAGKHAAGVIITPGPCTEYMPLYKQNEDITSQYEMEYIEKIGCLKVDFLGLRTLSVIKDAVDMINSSGKNVDIDNIPMDDPEVYELMSRGDTIGVFQFESGGMREYLKKLRPSCIEDLIAMNALYRPGPLGSNMVDDFIDRKHGTKKIEYSHPLLEEILKETYGVIVYQEQVMKIAHVMAGFSLGAADELRRAMGKKKADVMAQKKSEFVDGAINKGISEKIASDVFDLMALFAGYGFNKSHSAGYAILAYQTAWLKVHYPSEFMAAALSSEMDKTERIVILIEECKNMGITVLPPHVNNSVDYFNVEGGNVRYGLGGIKNVGKNAIEAIVNARAEGGLFSDIFDFCARIDMHSINKRMLESLIMAGAMDFPGAERAGMVEAIDLAVEYSQSRQKEKDTGQFSLFGDSGFAEQSETKPSLPQIPPWKRMEQLAKEKSVLGFWFSGHPLESFGDELKAFTTPFKLLSTKPDRAPVSVGGVITSISRKTTKKGDKPYISMRIEDIDSSGEVIMMNGAYDNFKEKVEIDSMVIVDGTVSNRNNSDQASVFANTVESLEEAREKRIKEVHIYLSGETITDKELKIIFDICGKYPGNLPLWINFTSKKLGKFEIKSKTISVSASPQFFRAIKKIAGEKGIDFGKNNR